MIFTNSSDSEPVLSIAEKSEIAEKQAINALNACKELPKHKRIQLERLIRDACNLAYKAGVESESEDNFLVDTDGNPC